MKKMELEIKLLNIKKEEIEEKFEKLKVKKTSDIFEKMYVYDLYSLDNRYLDALEHLNFYDSKCENPLKDSYQEKDQIKMATAIKKMQEILIEIDYLLKEENRVFIKNTMNINHLFEILNKKNYLKKLNEPEFIKFLNQFFLNPHKWMRLRQSNNICEITVKHIIPSNEFIEQIEETEIIVNSTIEEANELLETLGFQYKNYFEKKRIKYHYIDCEIDIDSWPIIPDYLEIEGESEEKIKKVLEILGYDYKDCISCTADEIFRKYGKSMFDQREMSFSTKNS